MNASEVKEGGRYVVRWGNIEPVVTVVGITYVSEYVKDSEGKTRGVGSPRYTVRREEDGHTKKLKFKDFIRACVPTVTIVKYDPNSRVTREWFEAAKKIIAQIPFDDGCDEQNCLIIHLAEELQGMEIEASSKGCDRVSREA